MIVIAAVVMIVVVIEIAVVVRLESHIGRPPIWILGYQGILDMTKDFFNK